MNTIERLPQTAYFWFEGLMRKCTHNVITKGFAPRAKGYRTCCTCHQIVWLPVDDEQFLINGKYDEEKIKQIAGPVPCYPAIPI